MIIYKAGIKTCGCCRPIFVLNKPYLYYIYLQINDDNFPPIKYEVPLIFTKVSKKLYNIIMVLSILKSLFHIVDCYDWLKINCYI